MLTTPSTRSILQDKKWIRGRIDALKKERDAEPEEHQAELRGGAGAGGAGGDGVPVAGDGDLSERPSAALLGQHLHGSEREEWSAGILPAFRWHPAGSGERVSVVLAAQGRRIVPMALTETAASR